MQFTRRAWLATGSLLFSLPTVTQGLVADDPLPGWAPGEVKQRLLRYIEQVTTEGSGEFIPVAERIAVFDNDGTLWPENPVPFQAAFALDTLRSLVADHPDWKSDPHVQAALAGDVPALLAEHHAGLLRVLALTHQGLTVAEFQERVGKWLQTARHPRFQRRYDECVYQPMLELLAHLRSRGFQTWIVSGGGADFMRVWSERVYGIPPQQVIGSHGRVKFEVREGKPRLVKTLEHMFVDDREGKPVAIHQFIGRQPVLAVGNSDGDKAMLEYTTIDNPRSSLGVILHHTDAEREYAYDAQPKSSGKLVEALADAPQRGWLVVDFRRDFRSLFPAPRG
ncbi:MAG: HAD family hydrolase [Planctomycetaceae bacterium]